MAAPKLTTYPLSEIVSLARARCPFYQRLYADLPAGEPTLGDLPTVDQDEFWRAHHRDRREVLTETPREGIVLNSGGTTGTPKFSYFNDAEWDSAVVMSARACEGAGLADGDRVANLFAAGSLYSSLIFATQSFKAMRPGVLQFPLGYSPQFENAAGIIRLFDIDTLAGFPTHLLRLIEHLDREDAPPVKLKRILFAGELFTPDQLRFLENRFPGIAVGSMSYASVDAGMIAYADATCGPGEHRVFDGATTVEICDEGTGEVIGETGRPGRVIFTCLTRKLMPLLRYPTGDLAQWVEPAGAADRRFRLLGRSEEGARISGFNVSVSGLRALLDPFRERLGIGEFQMVVAREGNLDSLTLRLVGNGGPAGTEEILEAFGRWQPEVVAEGLAGIQHPVRLEWIGAESLEVSERTGKLRRVVDRRREA